MSRKWDNKWHHCGDVETENNPISVCVDGVVVCEIQEDKVYCGNCTYENKTGTNKCMLKYSMHEFLNGIDPNQNNDCWHYKKKWWKLCI